MSEFEMRNVSVAYRSRGHQVIAVDDVTLHIPSGATLGLVGESGCGKSTIAKAAVGLVPFVSGTLKVGGEDFTQIRRRNSLEYRRQVQMVFQDPYSSLNPRMTVGEMFADAHTTRGTPRTAQETETRRLLDLVGLPAASILRYPHEFSGGQRQRVAIGRALAVNPAILITDEVTSSLDVSVQGSVLNLLRAVQRELDLSFLFISHDLSTVRYMSNHVAVMHMGQIVESAPSVELFSHPQHPYTRALLASIPRLTDHGPLPAPISGELPDPTAPPSGCRFHTRCPVGPLTNPTRQECVDIDPRLVPQINSSHPVYCHFAEGRPLQVTRAATRSKV